MRVLVACEFSGVVRDAFLARGHEAMSCDLLPTERPGPHYQGDLFDVIDYPWDLAIFHPECTHTAVSGARHFADKRMDGRQQAAVSFFYRIDRRSQHIPRRCYEQPVSIMSTMFRPPTQTIQPWMFGHDASKATCLWLRNLPPLRPTNVLPGGRQARRANQTASGQNKLAPSPNRWKLRSITYQGIADAMAEQWGQHESPRESPGANGVVNL